MRSSKQPLPVHIMTDQKQLDNVKCFKYFRSKITNDTRCINKIKSRIPMTNAAFNKKKNLFTRKLDLYIRKKLVKRHVWSKTLHC